MLMYLAFMIPPMLLAMWAQWRVQSTYAAALQVPARMSGAAAARKILDVNGLQAVDVELVDGVLSDHYDPSAKVLRLSQDVYHGRTAASIGIAAHEAGHAIQDAQGYSPLVIRNLAVPFANLGGTLGGMVILGAMLLHSPQLLLAGIVLFGAVAFFQLVNLPVEFDASNRAKAQLQYLGIADHEEMVQVRSVLNAAAWTYVAATLQSVMQVLYYLMIFLNSQRRSEHE